jgi:large subunit ribosomal protein L25
MINFIAIHIYMTVTLHIEKREKTGKQLEALRKEGKLPAVVYGPKQEATVISLDKGAFEKMLRESGESTVINLVGLGDEVEVLVHDVAFNPAKGGVIHVDFYAIEKGKEIKVHVPLEFVGEAPATKVGGSLTKILHEIEVTCKPTALPKHIVVDVSSLDDFEKQIQIKDLEIPKGVKVEHDGDEVVALVQEVQEEPESEVAAVDIADVEVEAKGKAEEKTDEAK